MTSDYGKFTPISVRSETSMTNDTKAPERIWVSPRYRCEAPDDYYLLNPKYRSGKGTEYTRADIALAAQGALIERAVKVADTWYRNLGKNNPKDEILSISPDATAALEAVRREEREHVVKAVESLIGRDIEDYEAIDVGQGYDLAIHEAIDAIRDTPPQET